MLNLTDDEIEHAYEELEEMYNKNLKNFGVIKPRLKNGNEFTINSLLLVYFYKRFN